MATEAEITKSSGIEGWPDELKISYDELLDLVNDCGNISQK